jgi:hypothetical protein
MIMNIIKINSLRNIIINGKYPEKGISSNPSLKFKSTITIGIVKSAEQFRVSNPARWR